MKLFYVANNRIPTEKAHGVNIAHMCSAFAGNGADVTLLLPARSDVRGDIFSAYGLEKNFNVEYLSIINIPFWFPGAFMLRTLLFARSVRARLQEEQGSAVVYARGEMILLLASLPERFKLAWETHIKPDSWRRYGKAVERAAVIIPATKHYAEEIPYLWPSASGKVFYAPDGVALESFKHLPEKEAARKQLGLPPEKKIALYAGSDVPWKGLHLLREASELLSEDALTVFVGDIKETSNASPRRLFVGTKPYSEIPVWLASADVLVLTGDATSETARSYTSPLKLFEYMASGRPIVATDLPAIRDILSEREAYLVAPDAKALTQAISEIFMHPQEAAVRANAARELVSGFSWAERAKRILGFISERA